jgi:hypothetical protein
MDDILHGEYAGRRSPAKQLRVLTWNNERGLKVDLNTKRTGKRDLVDVVAKRFGFDYVFGVEFEELSVTRAAQHNPIPRRRMAAASTISAGIVRRSGASVWIAQGVLARTTCGALASFRGALTM